MAVCVTTTGQGQKQENRGKQCEGDLGMGKEGGERVRVKGGSKGYQQL